MVCERGRGLFEVLPVVTRGQLWSFLWERILSWLLRRASRSIDRCAVGGRGQAAAYSVRACVRGEEVGVNSGWGEVTDTSYFDYFLIFERKIQRSKDPPSTLYALKINHNYYYNTIILNCNPYRPAPKACEVIQLIPCNSPILNAEELERRFKRNYRVD